MGTEHALLGENITRSFGDGDTRHTVLRGITLQLAPREIVLLMGPSGSGKTTLLGVLSGLLQPDSGRVIALGQNLWDMSERQREQFRLQSCGFIFQGYNLFGSLTARQQLEMVVRWGEGASASEAAARADEWLRKLDLSRKANARPMQLSGGEKQRVAIGRALIKNPTLCFADEPTSALDWEHGQDVIQLLKFAAQECGTTVLIVAHDERIKPFVDRVLYMEDGLIKRVDERPSSSAAAETVSVNGHAGSGGIAAPHRPN